MCDELVVRRVQELIVIRWDAVAFEHSSISVFAPVYLPEENEASYQAIEMCFWTPVNL